VGTSLPELATATVAAIRKHSEVAVGNILGAGIYNLFAIVGLVAVVNPIPVPPQILGSSRKRAQTGRQYGRA
jgi:cation:H+ antiporter